MKLKEHLESNRQWPRRLRITHAQYQLKQATSNRAQAFWQSVLKALGVRNGRKRKPKSARRPQRLHPVGTLRRHYPFTSPTKEAA